MDELASRVSQHIEKYFKSHQARLETLASERPPTILFIACIDARVVPELMLNVDPGDMMTLRVPGALVPPQGLGDVCVAGSIELVLTTLSSIKDIVVCGHTTCAFNAQLADGVDSFKLSNLSRWVSMADFARAQANTKADKNSDPDGYQQALLEFTVQRSLQSLREIDVVNKKEKADEITLHGWYFNLTTGQIMVLNEKSGVFEAVQMSRDAAPVKTKETASKPVVEKQPTTAPKETVQKTQTVQQAPQTQTEKTASTPSSSVPSVAPGPVAAAHQATPIDAKAPETVAPTPVNVPSARPVERVYASEVSRPPSTKSVATQSSTKPAQQQRPTSSRPTPPQRPQQSRPTSAQRQTRSRNSRDSLKQAADNVQAVLDEQTLRNLGDLLQDVRRPAQRMRVRNMLNQVRSPQGWQMVRNVVSSVQNADVRQALRELSIELSSPEARSQLRGIISGLGDDPAAGSTEGIDMGKIEQDFMSILNNLRDKK